MAKAKEDKLQTAKTYIGRAAASKFPAIFCVVFSFVVMSGELMSAFDWIDWRHSDILFRRRGMVEADRKIKILEIDDDSIKQVGQYPWPRSTYKKLIDKLVKDGVSVVALDVLLIDPSRPEEDRELIDVTRRHSDKVVHAVMSDNKILNQMEFVYPFPALRKVTKNFGQVTQPIKDNDGSFRVEPLVIGSAPRWRPAEWATDPGAMPTLGLAALALHEKKDFRSYLKLPGLADDGAVARLNFSGEEVKRMGVQTLPDGSEEEIFSKRYGIERIPAWRVLKGEMRDEQRAGLKDAIVFIGSTGQGAFDHFPSPFTGSEPGVVVHATLADNLIRNRYITESSPLTPLVFIPVMVIAAYLIVKLSPLWSGLSFVGVLFGALAGHEQLFRSLYWMPVAGPLCAFVGTFLVLIVHRTIEENRKAAEVRGMFGQYVPPEVVDILVKNPERLKLGGEKRDMTMFFLDIAHFTTISEKMSPEALIQFLNHYLTALTDDIFHNNGVVDKYIGDCVMAFWNAPLDEPDHRRKACLAAVACVATIERLNKEYVDPSMPETPKVRIGLNSGEVVVGNTGSARKLAYTVLGDEVNLASRLEGANKFFGSTLMASEDTYSEGKDVVEGRLLGAVRVVGKAIPIKVYELLAKKGELPANWAKGIPIYHEAIVHYENKRFAEALKGFEEFLKHVPDDKTAKLYMNACNDYVVIPPPEGWEPVFNLTSK